VTPEEGKKKRPCSKGEKKEGAKRGKNTQEKGKRTGICSGKEN